MDRSVVLDALRSEGDRLAAALAPLDEGDFDRPTRCPPWSVRELLAHVLVACDRLPAMLDGEPPVAADVAAWGYFRGDARFAADANAVRVAAARADAESFASGHELASTVVATIGAMADRAAAEPAERLVRTRWGDAMELDDFLATRVVELVVHGLDLARAIDRPPWPSAEALAVTLAVLVDGPAGDALAGTGWDAVELVERATGRTPLSDDDRRIARLRPVALG